MATQTAASSTIRQDMPVLLRHEGEWVGVYTHVDATGKVIDEHRSHLRCTFPDEGPYPYYQINTYTWEDGRREELHFPATYRDKKIWWDTDRIEGYAWEVDPRTVVLTWTRKGEPNTYLYEMIQISEDNRKRARTWHWFHDDQMFQRTLIKEERVG